jgi:hypothetical protein
MTAASLCAGMMTAPPFGAPSVRLLDAVTIGPGCSVQAEVMITSEDQQGNKAIL